MIGRTSGASRLHGLCTSRRVYMLREAAKITVIGLKSAKFSLHKKWNNCPHSLSVGDCWKIHHWAKPLGFVDGI